MDLRPFSNVCKVYFAIEKRNFFAFLSGILRPRALAVERSLLPAPEKLSVTPGWGVLFGNSTAHSSLAAAARLSQYELRVYEAAFSLAPAFARCVCLHQTPYSSVSTSYLQAYTTFLCVLFVIYVGLSEHFVILLSWLIVVNPVIRLILV